MNLFRFTLVAFLLATTIAGAWTTDLKAIKAVFTEEQIIELFEQARRYDWPEEYIEKGDEVFILTSKFLYRARLLDDDTLVFDQIKSRYYYDMQVPFWTIILVFIISGVALFLVFFLPSEWRLRKKKP